MTSFMLSFSQCKKRKNCHI